MTIKCPDVSAKFRFHTLTVVIFIGMCLVVALLCNPNKSRNKRRENCEKLLLLSIEKTIKQYQQVLFGLVTRKTQYNRYYLQTTKLGSKHKNSIRT